MIKLKANKLPVIHCDDMQTGIQILVNGKIETVVRIIVMHNNKREVTDIEILLNKKKNLFFSWNMYVSGKSWVTDLYRIGEIKQERES